MVGPRDISAYYAPGVSFTPMRSQPASPATCGSDSDSDSQTGKLRNGRAIVDANIAIFADAAYW